MTSGSQAKAINKGPWQKDEDDLLVRYVEAQAGANAWGKISETLGTRSAKQCRERWHQNLKPGLNHTAITDDEARFIVAQVSSRGKRWAEIARMLHGRSDNMIKNWWNGSNNRRAREVCESSRRGNTVAPVYPLHQQQQLPNFQQTFAPATQSQTQNPYGYASATLPLPSPPSPPSSSYSLAPRATYYPREQLSEPVDRRNVWTGPGLHIESVYHSSEQRHSLSTTSTVTTPTESTPATPNHLSYVPNMFAPSQQNEQEYYIDPQIRQASSRRGSAYSEAHHYALEQPMSSPSQSKDFKSAMNISNLLS